MKLLLKNELEKLNPDLEELLKANQSLQLPLDPRCRVKRLKVSDCGFMDSAKVCSVGGHGSICKVPLLFLCQAFVLSEQKYSSWVS